MSPGKWKLKANLVQEQSPNRFIRIASSFPGAFGSGPGATCIMIASFGANLHLNTWLCYCSSAAGKLFARPGPRASVVLHGAAGTVGTAAADPSRPALGTSDKVMPSQGYHENCPAPAGQLLLMRLNNEWQREGKGHATWGRRIWCLGRAWAWIWIWALHLGLGLQSRSP